MKKFLPFLLLCSFSGAFALDPTHFTITRISAPYFIVDGNSPATITKSYVGFEITNNSNSAVTYNNLKFTVTSIGTSVIGQNYSLVSPSSGIANVGTLAPGASKVCYFYVSYPANVTPQATFNITLSDNTASSKTQSFVIRNRSCISANAGGTATQSFSNQDLIGGIITDDVTYAVGNVQNGDESDFQVAVSPQFDPTKILLLGTQVISSTVPGVTAGATDSLYFITGNGSTGATVTIRWTFRIASFNFTNYLLPCAGATSGSTNYKYALNTSLGSGSPVTISSSANPLTISKTSDKTLYLVSSAAIFTVTIQNPGAYGVTIDKIADQLPAGFTFQSIHASSQVTSANSTSIPSTGTTGTLNFEAGVSSGANTSYYVPAGGSYVLKYTATASSSIALNLLTTAQDFVGSTVVGSAFNTVSVSTVLPVKLISFKGGLNNNNVKLDWITGEEVNTTLFEIEKKNENGEYEKIGTMNAAGNSSQSLSYSFVDKKIQSVKNYYRLKMIDQDGKFEYSNVVSIYTGEKVSGIQPAYPNPFTDNVIIPVSMHNDSKVFISIYDFGGRIVKSETRFCPTGDASIRINELSCLSAGNYILKISTAEETVEQKLIKTR